MKKFLPEKSCEIACVILERKNYICSLKMTYDIFLFVEDYHQKNYSLQY